MNLYLMNLQLAAQRQGSVLQQLLTYNTDDSSKMPGA